METHVTISVPDELTGALNTACERLGMTPERFIETALAAGIASWRRGGWRGDGPDLEDPLLIGLRARYGRALSLATSWADLDSRLAAQDLALARSGGGLALMRRATGERICRASDVGPGAASLERRFGPPETLAPKLDPPDPPKASTDVERARAQVAQALKGASDWSALQARLAEHDLAYRPAGRGLEIIELSTQARVAKASAIGPGYAQLVRRMGAGYPGHPHAWLAERVLAGKSIWEAASGDGRQTADDALIDYADA